MGLDALRAVAILCVLLGHSVYLFRGVLPDAFKIHLWWSFIGIEIFFVLSGYLVGAIALGTVGRGAPVGSFRSENSAAVE